LTEIEALRTIQGFAGANRITYTRHARERMHHRGATEDDVRRAIATASSAQLQDSGTWRVAGGVDRAGDGLTVVVALKGDVVVVTVF